MKTKYVVLTAVLTLFLTLPMVAQYDKDNDSSGTTLKNRGMSMIGKPVYESTVQGTHLKVWVMSRNEHKKWMDSKSYDSKSYKDSIGMDRLGTDKGTNSDRMGTDNRTSADRMGTDNRTGTDRMGTESKSGTMGSKHGMKSEVTGTHHIMIEATDETNNEAVAHLTGTIQVTSPSMKTTSVELEPRANHYGADVNLDEKGQYQFTLNLTVDGTSKTAQFQYTPTSTSSTNLLGR